MQTSSTYYPKSPRRNITPPTTPQHGKKSRANSMGMLSTIAIPQTPIATPKSPSKRAVKLGKKFFAALAGGGGGGGGGGATPYDSHYEFSTRSESSRNFSPTIREESPTTPKTPSCSKSSQKYVPRKTLQGLSTPSLLLVDNDIGNKENYKERVIMSRLSVEFLKEQGYTKGLIEALGKNRKDFPLSVWIVDNSLSMNNRDGHMIDCNYSSKHAETVKFTKCTRWEEIQQTIDYHVKMAAILKAPTIFRMMNEPPSPDIGPQQFNIAMAVPDQSPAPTNINTVSDHVSGPKSPRRALAKYLDERESCRNLSASPRSPVRQSSQVHMFNHQQEHDKKAYKYEDLEIAQKAITRIKPCGEATPITKCLKDVRQNLVAIQDQLKSQVNKRVVLVIATDGVPATTEEGNPTPAALEEFTQALLSLKDLPVWIVLRLCTDDENVVQYWNHFNSDGLLDIEILDDYVSEAKEVYENNKWLNYGLPLHRMRKMGFYNDVFDLLDERTLNKAEIYSFLQILLGKKIMSKAPPFKASQEQDQECFDEHDENSSNDNNNTHDDEECWDEFCDYVEECVLRETLQWNPIRKRIEPWINIKELRKISSLANHKKFKLPWLRRGSV